MDEKFRQLIELGAGEFEQLNASVIAHLEGTRCLLKAWNASEILQQAGLYHAAYRNSALRQNIFELSQRAEVAVVIGTHVENIIYHYFACDRDAFYTQLGLTNNPMFYDRITSEKSDISFELLQQLCELTAANATELAINNPEFIVKHGTELVDLFRRMQRFLSDSAQRKIEYVFASTFKV
jgi:hypothetical protein